MPPRDQVLPAAEKQLLKIHAEFERPGKTPLAAEFYALAVQASIFQYDVARITAFLWTHQPQGFALKVTLRDLVHKMYEYDQALSMRLVNRLLNMARSRGVPVEGAELKVARKQWKSEFARLSAWAEVRNQAGAHYGKDIANQVLLIEQLEKHEVMHVARAFLSYNLQILKSLSRVGQGKGSA